MALVANFVMVMLILVIAAAGILTVGSIRGWFDRDGGEAAVLTDLRGILTMERDGVAYQVDADTLLRQGDKITCAPGATATIRLDDDRYLAIGEKAALTIGDPSVEAFAADVTAGEVFAFCFRIGNEFETQPIMLGFDGKQIQIRNAIASLSVRSGAQSVNVYYGSVEDAASGQVINWVGTECSVDTLSINALNSFLIAQVRLANSHGFTCFTDEMLDQLVSDRKVQLQEQIPAASTSVDPTEDPTVDTTTSPDPADATSASSQDPAETEPENPTTTEVSSSETETTEPEPTETTAAGTEPSTTPPTETEPPATDPVLKCTISIRCDTILDNMDSLDPGKAPYVPDDGWILWAEVEFIEGETVFDVLKRVCSAYGIQLEYSWTPMYNSYYIEGIHNLYEFDCGSESGWMYKVNGWFPNYGCSSYTLSDGDTIVWCYTCVGLGADVGA